jgi:hypothetical protein
MEEATIANVPPSQQNNAVEPASAPLSQEAAIAWIGELAQVAVANLERQNKLKTVYANNFRLELSAWDLKILFGQLDQQSGSTQIDWQTAVTIPWSQVKILDYFLRTNIVYREKLDGEITIPARVIPTPPVAPTEEQITANPKILELHEAYRKIHAEIFGEKD